MNIFFHVLLSLIVVSYELTTCESAGAPITFPVVISSGKNKASSWSAIITVKEHRHVNHQVSFNTRSYCYKNICSYPGPTVSVHPGDNFTLILINELGIDDSNSEYIMNTMHGANTTNIHTHGIHVDPKVDNVFLSAAPGQQLIYPYQIPRNHAPGNPLHHFQLCNQIF